MCFPSNTTWPQKETHTICENLLWQACPNCKHYVRCLKTHKREGCALPTNDLIVIISGRAIWGIPEDYRMPDPFKYICKDCHDKFDTCPRKKKCAQCDLTVWRRCRTCHRVMPAGNIWKKHLRDCEDNYEGGQADEVAAVGSDDEVAIADANEVATVGHDEVAVAVVGTDSSVGADGFDGTVVGMDGSVGADSIDGTVEHDTVSTAITTTSTTKKGGTF